MNRAERLPELNLEPGAHYYVAGYGVMSYAGPVHKSGLNKNQAQYFALAEQVLRFEPDLMSSRTEPVFIDSRIVKNDNKVYKLPDAEQLKTALLLLRSLPQPLQQDSELIFKSRGVIDLAQIVRDSKASKNTEVLHQATKNVLGHLVAHHLGNYDQEGIEYVDAVISARDWPEEVPLLPRNQDDLRNISAEYKKNKGFSPGFMETVRTSNVFPIQFAQVSQTEQGTRDAAKSSSAIIKSINPQAGNESGKPLQQDIFSQDSGLYRKIEHAFSGQPVMEVFKAGVNIITADEAKDLLRLVRVNNVYSFKNNLSTAREEAGEQGWNAKRVDKYFSDMFAKIEQARPGEDGLGALFELKQKIGLEKKARQPQVQIVHVPMEIQQPEDPMKIRAVFTISVLKPADEPISDAVRNELEEADECQQGKAAFAANILSPIAYQVFSMATLRTYRRNPAEIAPVIGTDQGTVKTIFTRAVQAVDKALADMQADLRVDANPPGFEPD